MTQLPVRKRILVSRVWPQQALDDLRERYDVCVHAADAPLSQNDWREAMGRFDALCPTVVDRIDAAVLETPERQVAIIANFGAGYDHIDLAAARRGGIVVTNTPDVLSESTAQLAVLLLLMTARRAGEGERELRAGRWTGWRPTHLMGQSLNGKLLGLVGFGRIARETARIAQSALGMRIAYHSRNEARLDPGDTDAQYFADLEDLLRVADCISLHCPGGAATYHLINRSRLALLKPAAILINTARGSVVDEDALADALEQGAFAAAGLDVYESEPAVHPRLLALDNIVLLPHLGSATIETRTAMGLRAAANLDAFFAGREPRDRVV